MRGKIIILVGLIVFIFPVFLKAGGNGSQHYVLQRINGVVKLNGLSDEAAWEGVQPLPVVMHIPHLGKEPTEKTVILVAYDNEFLYVAGRLYETDPAKILSSTMQRDSFGPGNDWFGIIIDTFNDKENALAFFTTPAGLRLDFTVFNDGRGDFPLNLSWNTFWDVAVVRNREGWFAEMRIPFSSLRFQDKGGQVVMGLMAWRYISHKNELISFPQIPNDRGPWGVFMPSLTREILLTGVHSRKALYVTPYVLGGYSRSAELNVPETAYEQINDPAFEAGIDIKYGISSNLTLDVTVNTDFAQVEADDQQVNLTRFSLFFPEKRLFFQERSGIFDFSLGSSNRLFYSRQIGIYDDQPVRIYGGARLVGRLGSWDLGMMSMQTAPLEDQPAENFSVLRLRRRIFNPYSYIGGMVTSRLGADGSYNIAYGLDGILRLFEDDYLVINWAQTFEEDAANKLFSLESSQIRVDWERRNSKGFNYEWNYSRAGAAYNPEMGFLEREDYTKLGSRVAYGWFPGEKSKLQQHGFFLNGVIFIGNRNKLTESAELGGEYELITKSGYYGKLSCKYFYENVTEGFSFAEEEDDDDEEPDPDPDIPIGQYSFYGLEAIFNTPMNKRVSLESNLYAGTFYDGWGVSMTLTPRWNISSGLELSGTYQFNGYRFPDRGKKFIAHIGRLRILNTWSIKFSTSAFIQYNSAIDAVIANIRFRYNPREGNDLYLVYNEELNTRRFREVPFLPVTNNRTIMLKYTYTLRF